MISLKKLFKRRKQPKPSDILTISVIARRKSKEDKVPKGLYNAVIVVKKNTAVSGDTPCTAVIKFETSGGDSGPISVAMLKDGDGVKVTL